MILAATNVQRVAEGREGSYKYGCLLILNSSDSICTLQETFNLNLPCIPWVKCSELHTEEKKRTLRLCVNIMHLVQIRATKDVGLFGL